MPTREHFSESPRSRLLRRHRPRLPNHVFSGQSQHPDRCRHWRGDLTLEEMRQIDHVFLTHSHLDHIAALPLMLDAVSSLRSRLCRCMHWQPPLLRCRRMSSTTSFGLISVASPAHRRFCGTYPWPLGRPSPLMGWWCGCCQPCTACRLWAMRYEASTAGGPSAEIPSAIRRCGARWSSLPKPPPPQLPVAALVIETAFSNRESDLARRSQHLSPTTLAAELALRAPTASYPIYITHTKPSETELILQEINQLELAEDVEIGWLQGGRCLRCNETCVG